MNNYHVPEFYVRLFDVNGDSLERYPAREWLRAASPQAALSRVEEIIKDEHGPMGGITIVVSEFISDGPRYRRVLTARDA